MRNLALLCVMSAMASVSHAGWLEELNPFQPTEVIPLAQGGQVDEDVPHGMLPFTTYEAEQRSITDSLPCKWISMGGGQGESRYDFLCKGGTWATVSLMLDKSPMDAGGVGRVRLIFREWPENVNPGGGEAYVAQQFLQHVTSHFVPANLAKEIEAAFWYRRDRHWAISRTMEIGYTYENQEKFALHRLEIRGRAKAIKLRGAARIQTAVTPTEAGLGRSEQEVGQSHEVKVMAPVVASPTIPRAKPVEEPATDNQQPTTVDNPKALQNATSADINPFPEPTSLEKPRAPEVSTTLIPDAKERINNRTKAPTNFNAYNKAEELTKDFEAAATSEAAKDKVKATQATPVPMPADAPVAAPTLPNHATDTPATTVQATPTPSLDAETATPLEAPKAAKDWPQGEGLGNPTTLPVNQVAPSVEGDIRFTPTRSLPQLKFIPKAIPLERADDVIQFEDEGSGL